MKKSILSAALLAMTISACTRETDTTTISGASTPLESITAEVASAVTRSAEDPTAADIAQRAEAGHKLYVTIGGHTAPYIFENGVWRPESDPVRFDGYARQKVEMSLQPAEQLAQDGSPEGLLSADRLVWEQESAPVNNLSDIEMIHGRTLVEIALDGGFEVDNGSDIIVASATAYRTAGSDVYMAIIDSGMEEFGIKVMQGGVYKTVPVSKTLTETGAFLPNYRYRITLTGVGMEVGLKAMFIEPWSNGGTISAQRGKVTTFDFGDNFPQNATVTAYLSSGKTAAITMTGRSTGELSSLESAVITAVRIGEAEQIAIGRKAGGNIEIDVTADGGDITLRREGNIAMVGTLAELTKIDSDGNRAGEYAQQADLYFTSVEWLPLCDHREGYGTWFDGVYDGNGYAMYDFVCKEGLSGVFRNNAGTIRNITIASGAVGGEGLINVSAVCAFNVGTIENCVNAAQVTGDSFVAGICALNRGTVTGCKNRGMVKSLLTTQFANVGGIVSFNGDSDPNSGESTATGYIIECTNEGAVSSEGGYYVGGIAAINRSGEIVRCVNSGQIYDRYYYVAGIASENSDLIAGCRNTGTVRGGGLVAGITALSWSGTVVSSENTGAITAEEIGGAAGIVCQNNANMLTSGLASVTSDCRNRGRVTAKGNVGGIAMTNGAGVVAACINEGAVESSGSGMAAGGIAGDNGHLILASYNTASVKAMDNVGGVVGVNSNTVRACYSTVYVSGGMGSTAVGGVVGLNRKTEYSETEIVYGQIYDCYYAGASKGVGSNLNPDESQVMTAYFSTASWPTDDPSKGWGIGNDYEKGLFWNALGGYVSGRPTYPTLSWTAASTAAVDRKLDRAAVATKSLDTPLQCADPLRAY